jgi:hypothetical protein
MTEYPFPKFKTDLEIDRFIYNKSKNTSEWIDNYYKKSLSEEGNITRLLYLSIEKMLLDTFEYVSPTLGNINTSSVKFSTIIREASNLFEQSSRKLYFSIYEKGDGRVNIKNFLTLDKFLRTSEVEIFCPKIAHLDSSLNLTKPFSELDNWDCNSTICTKHTPEWWNAYNKIKHDNLGLQEFATLKNAIRSVSAIYIWLKSIYGSNLLGSKISKVEIYGTEKLNTYLPNDGSKLFPDSIGSISTKIE